jgi:hypothetical protein
VIFRRGNSPDPDFFAIEVTAGSAASRGFVESITRSISVNIFVGRREKSRILFKERETGLSL